MISSIRSYFVSRIAECYPDKFQIDDPIGEDDLSRNDADNGYKIIFGATTGFLTGQSYGNTIPLEVHLFKKSGLETTEPFDSLYEEAIDIKNRVLNPTLAKNSLVFNDIEFLSIAPSALQSDDKIYKMILTFNLRIDFSF